jgi:hypothetical protein
VCLFLQSTGLNRFVGASYGAQPQVHRHVEEAIGLYRQQESARLAQAMPAQDLPCPQDETWTGGLSLVGMEPVSHSILLEHAACARDHDPWQACMEQALVGRNCRSIQATRDEAPGLLASVAHHLGAQHSPDLFHVQQALRKAVAAPMAAKVRAAAQVVVRAAAALHHVQEPLPPTASEPDKPGPGRRPKAAAHLAKGEQDGAAARQAHHRLAGQRAQVAQSLRALGQAEHFVD